MSVEVPVSIEQVAPRAGTPLRRLQHIQIVVDQPLDYLTLTAVFPSGRSEIIFANEAFEPEYERRSAAHYDVVGARLVILRDQGWPEHAVQLRARAFNDGQSDPFSILLF